jgi:hypothetical protein
VARELGWKMRRLLSSVMMRVFEAWVGCDIVGRLERSSVRVGLDDVEEDREAQLALKEGDPGGEVVRPAMFSVDSSVLFGE